MSARQRLLTEGLHVFFYFFMDEKKGRKTNVISIKRLVLYSRRRGCVIRFEVGDISPEQTNRCERAEF